MFTRTKTIKGREYSYVEHSFRIGKSIAKISFYLPKDQKIEEFSLINQKTIQKVVQQRVDYISKNLRPSHFFTYGPILKSIEEKRVQFQVLFRFIKASRRKEIMEEFLRVFLVNSMAMEGGTISYDLAKALDEKKKIKLENINQLDIPLYAQLQEAYQKLDTLQLRYPKQLRDLHELIYKGIYPFAGRFRTNKVTFGDLQDLALTVSPDKISTSYQKALKNYYQNKGESYDFERVVSFHINFQGVHGFQDGNSRLGRLIMMHQFLQLGYPPPLLRGTQSKGYRRALVQAINKNKQTPCLKLFYRAYIRTWNKFWIPILQEALKP